MFVGVGRGNQTGSLGVMLWGELSNDTSKNTIGSKKLEKVGFCNKFVSVCICQCKVTKITSLSMKE